ncbi:MAG: methionyl-tRNA formyltransferase [Deltaproteobacteria bacterium]|nr:methionyl-tRNA formyltransferase [Deltaproteobacteria bacterium]
MEIEPDLLILAGYGKIIKEKILRLARIMCLNLHAGKLPKYRGSSPMNWALINGETSFTLSIIKVNKGIDTGDLLQEKTFPISLKDTIKTLHDLAAEEFPLLLLKTLSGIRNGTLAPSRQIREEASYYPLRFPEDGLILWDRLTAMEIHNRIRALAPPYPSAFTFYRGRKVKLVSSELHDFDFFGEPGRIYRITKRGFLICARDKCLWIREALFSESRESLHEIVHPYDKLLTLSGFVLDQMGAGHDY